MDRTEHWNQVYEANGSSDVSWFQPVPLNSMRLLDVAGLTPSSCVIDVGGGDSRLVDALLDRGLQCVTVLDVSGAAIARVQQRLGNRASIVRWVVADVTGAWPVSPVDIWHDRAAFHFLVDEEDRARYVANLHKALKPGGHVIIASFAPDGPAKCSGLPVMRHSAKSLAAELGAGFELLHSYVEPHQTPMGTTQSFLYAAFRLNATSLLPNRS
jgi:SAM-dependent methyltransferase